MRYRKVRTVLQYHVPNKLLSPEKFAHHVLLLFYPFRDEKELLSGFSPLYQNKLQEQGVQDVVNTNKIKLLNHMLISLIRLILNLMRPWLTIKTHKATLKMMKHQGQNILMKVIQKTEKQTKLQQLPDINYRYWFKVGRNIYYVSWKNIYWSFSFDCSSLTSTTSSQGKTYIFSIFW